MVLWLRDLARLNSVILLLVSPGIIRVVAVVWWLVWGWMDDPCLSVLVPSWDCLNAASHPPGGPPWLLPLTVWGQYKRES